MLFDLPQNLMAFSLLSLKDKNAFEKTTIFDNFPALLYELILSISDLLIDDPLYR